MIDDGLSKKGLQEVQNIVSNSIGELKDDVDGRLTRMEKYQNKKWEEMGEFKKAMYNTLDKIDKAVVGLEFQHSWKTAMWVCIGSALPTAIGVTFFFLKF